MFGLGYPLEPCFVWRREALPCFHAGLHNFDIAQNSGRISAPCLLRYTDVAPTVLTINASTMISFRSYHNTFVTRCLRFMPPFLMTMQNSLPVGDRPSRVRLLIRTGTAKRCFTISIRLLIKSPPYGLARRNRTPDLFVVFQLFKSTQS
jgi:hypothetical protein